MAQTLAELLVGVGIDTTELTAGADEAASRVEGSLGGIQTAAAGAAVGGLFMAGLSNAMDASAANTKLKNQLDLTAPEASRAGKVAGDVFSAGFGGSIEDVNASIQGVVSSMGGMAKIGDAELKNMTQSALMLAETFEIDVADSSAMAGQLIKNGLVKDSTEAFDVITTAAQKMPAALIGDMPDIVGQYAIHWARVGLSAKDAFGMMSQYAAAGGRDFDQAGDVIHEFARITSEEADVAAVAFKGLGLNSKQMLADVHKGGAPAKKALTETLDALRKLGPGAKQSSLAVDLFGDMAGEGAEALWAMDPATAAASTGMADVAGAAKEASDNVAASKSMEVIWRTMATTIGDALAPALEKISTFMREHPGVVKVLVPVLLGLAAAIGIAAVAQWVWNSALLASPVTWIIVAIIALVVIIVLIATKTTWFQTAWAWVWDNAKKGFALAVNGINAAADWLNALPGRIMGWFAKAALWAINKMLALVAWLNGLPGRAISALSSLAGRLIGLAVSSFVGFHNAAVAKGNTFLGWVKGLPGRAKGALGNMGSLLFGAGRSIIQGLINGVTGMIGSLQSRFSSITAMIPDWKGPMTVDMQLLTPSGAALMDGLMGGIDDQVPALHKQLNGITSDIPANVNIGVRTAGRSGPGGAQVLKIESGGSEMDDLIVKILRRSIAADSGGDVQRHLGAPA